MVRKSVNREQEAPIDTNSPAEGKPNPVLVAKARRALERGKALLELNDFKGATPVLEDANAMMEEARASPRDRMDAILPLARLYFKVRNHEKGEAFSERAKSLIGRPEIPADSKGWALFLYGLAMYHKSDLESALKHYERALPLFKAVGDKEGIAFTYKNISNVHFYKCLFSKAIVYNDRALKLFQEMDIQREVWMIHNNIALAMGEQGNYKDALKEFELVLDKAKSFGDKMMISTCLVNIGYIYLQMELFDKALQCYKESSILANEVGDLGVMAYNIIGNLEVLVAKGDIDEARRLLDGNSKSLMASKSSDIIGRVLRVRGTIHRERGELEKAEDDFALIEQRITAVNYRIFLSEVYIEWARTAMKAKDEKRARELFGKARAIYSELRLPLLEKELEMAMKQAGL